MRKSLVTAAAGLVTLVLVQPVSTQSPSHPPAATRPQPQPVAVDQPPPKDLRPLLVPRQSETRLVAQRYTLDRVTLAANYLGGAQPRIARGTPPPAPGPVLSPNMIARLKRFDLDWQAALGQLDAARLTAAGRSDLDTLEKTIASNVAQLEEDERALAQLSPVVPFAPAIVALVESRIRIEPIDARQAAGVLTGIARDVATARKRLEEGLAADGTADALRVEKPVAERAANAVGTLQAALAEWFTFYNGYDPLFTWWADLPFRRADEALKGYASLLRDTVVPASAAAGNGRTRRPSHSEGGAAPEGRGEDVAPVAAPIPPAPAPRFPSVPDLQEIISLPHDEMAAIVERFRGPVARGGRGLQAPPVGAPGQPAQAGQPSQPGQTSQPAQPAQPTLVRDKAFYEGWLKALRTLDFNRLSRPAQIDYLYIRTMAEQHAARSGVTLPADPPRKADASGIQGPARGRQALVFDLQDELIPYSPEELIAIGERELAWCEREMRAASRAMGLGDDWKAALEKVKGMHPPVGGQADVVRGLMFEAVDYLRQHDLLTVPAVAAESLRMIMMTPERQLVNPFFTGGNHISVSYPTNTMEYEARLQSMRGNNTPFSHATAFHEMIPGHNLVFYMTARYNGYRPSLAGNSPFYSEGWPIYWELLFYDIGFHATPEQKIGALFWRMHRCARIIFSLKFHLGEWSPQECIDFLVDRVGFEPDNAAGEVRRSFNGSYPPLYQLAYLIGGLQMRAIRKELVDQGQMPQKAFHDETLRQGNMPLALLRLALGRQKLTPRTSVEWRFY